MNVVIKAENIAKKYRLGLVGSETFKEDLLKWWALFRGKEDPYKFIGEDNIHNKSNRSNYVWSLKDINFEINQGDVVGIVGRNGAGKSTLLKILSKVTAPTLGSIKAKGRITSLLEVGTGFHPELTGRENIFLNGAILGMRKSEIVIKLDEIISFAGVEKYIDTPVKRYSSGMYVRLAFAVAAHLDSEILIIDEVLAVGDFEFQQKCIGKMNDVSKSDGKTVIFVSHNLSSISQLCNTGILLEDGKMRYQGDIRQVISLYTENLSLRNQKLIDINNRQGNGKFLFSDISIFDHNDNNFYVETFSRTVFRVYYKLVDKEKINSFKIDIGIYNNFGEKITTLTTNTSLSVFNFNQKDSIDFIVDKIPLAPGNYFVNLFCEINHEISDWLINSITFAVIEKDYYNIGRNVNANESMILLDVTIE